MTDPRPVPVRLYTRRLCGYCWAARRLLEAVGADVEEIPLDRDPELRRSLSEANGGWATLPMVFIGDDLVRLHRRGELEALLEGAA